MRSAPAPAYQPADPRLERVFRLSTYLTLVAASACLVWVEEKFLPGIVALLVPVGLLLGLAYAVEGRWVLSPRAANLLGVPIMAGAVLWIAHPLLQSGGVSSPRVALVLPYLGPVLLVVMLAKLFRPKQTLDFWGLHGVGLLEVTLACVMATEALFGVLLFLYLMCVLWSLALFYLHREQQRAEGRERVRAAHGLRATARLSALRRGVLSPLRSLRWALTVGGLAFLLFLLLPRGGESTWDPFTLSKADGTLSTGYTQGINLNRTGKVQLSDAVAFEVYVEDAQHRPKLDLPADQRWRGSVLDHYDDGRWDSRSHMAPKQPAGARPAQRELPHLGPAQFFLTFSVDSVAAQGLFLADPVALPAGPLLPVVDLAPAGQPQAAFYADQDGTLMAQPELARGHYFYRQVAAPPADIELGPPVHVDAVLEKEYAAPPGPGLREWTAVLLQRLQAEGRLTSKDASAQESGPFVPSDKRETVARALAEHLASSGEFSYSLQLRRKYVNLDATEDFLRHVRQGHCERYASALALMLRACRIPSRVVVGFRGAEARGEPINAGRYYVRQSHAHSWVEALVVRPGPDGTRQRHWLTLDPTPGEEFAGVDTSLLAVGWKEFAGSGGGWWRSFVLDYNTERRSEAAALVTNGLAERTAIRALLTWVEEGPRTADFWIRLGPWLIAACGLITCGYLLRRLRRPRRPRPAATLSALAAYGRLQALLKRHLRLTPTAAQTPLELAEAAEPLLRSRQLPANLVGTPRRLVDVLYRVEYGGQPLTAADQKTLDNQVAALTTALTALPAQP